MEEESTGLSSTNRVVATVLSVGGLLVLIGAGVYNAGTIKDFLAYFATVVDDWGPLGVLAYFGLYTLLEVLALPAIPLTMTAGAIFGILPGTLITSLAGTLAATISFLIARYVARDKVRPLSFWSIMYIKGLQYINRALCCVMYTFLVFAI